MGGRAAYMREYRAKRAAIRAEGSGLGFYNGPSIEQARIVYRFVRANLETGGSPACAGIDPTNLRR